MYYMYYNTSNFSSYSFENFMFSAQFFFTILSFLISFLFLHLHKIFSPTYLWVIHEHEKKKKKEKGEQFYDQMNCFLLKNMAFGANYLILANWRNEGDSTSISSYDLKLIYLIYYSFAGTTNTLLFLAFISTRY